MTDRGAPYVQPMTDTPSSDARAVNVPAGRISRIARLGSMATRVAGAMAATGLREVAQGNRPDMRQLLLTPDNIRRITDDLARMRGAAMKVGQLVSMDSGEMLPPELAQIVARLRADADYMPPKQIKQVLTAAWGPDWLRRFKQFNVRPIAAASIGQVHRAETRDGRDMAIKVQYPGVARSIDSDVANIGALLKVSGLLPKGFEIDPYLAEATRQLHEETDYLREGQCLVQFRGLLAGDPDFVIPELHEDFTTQSILAMSFVPSRPIEEAEGADQDTRNRVAERVLTLALRELFDFNVMQTDPNFANYRLEPDTGRIVLLDFGATRRFSGDVVAPYQRLFQAGLERSRDGLRTSAQEIGFLADGVPESYETAVLDMMVLVFETLCRAPIYNFGDPELQRRLNAMGMDLAEQGIAPPPIPMDALFIQRKLAGTFLLASRLRAQIPLTALLERFAFRQAGAFETAAC